MAAQRFRVGDATATILNLGDLRFKLKDVERSPESEWRPRYGDLFETPLLFPSQSVHLSTGEESVLVDAGDYSLFAAADPSYSPQNYTPPPGIVEQLAAIGFGKGDITYVVITHAHYDHFAGVTTNAAGEYSPTFPNARYLLGRGDWERPEMREALSDPNSPESHTLGVLESSNLLDLIDGEQRLTAMITTAASPGESPGHRIVRVNSNGQTLYCLGDLFHHALEVEDVNLMAQWCDALANKRSRGELIRAALREDALLFAAHMPPGRLSGTVEMPRFAPV